MALSNKEKVGRGFELLAAGLRPFVDRYMRSAAPEGQDWVRLLEDRDAARHGVEKMYLQDDPRFLVRVLTEERRTFGKALSSAHISYASELREVGNRWAHDPSVSSDDTARALDTMERLLTAVGAAAQAAQVSAIRLDHQRAAFEELTKKTVRAAVGSVSTPGTGLKAWREIITPHPDVARGQFNAAEFAADLHQVANGQAIQREYADPIEFFARTYLTEGLKDLLDRAVRRLSGDNNASPVVNLQTNFGGGKTHSMLALFHLFSGLPASSFPQGVQEVVAGHDLAALKVRRVTLVGTHLAPHQPLIKEDGTEVRTLWGELAWQLGGRAAFDVIAAADASGTPPGEALTGLLREHAPVIILIDEWVAYARGLYGQEGLAGGRFENQFTFAQALTEAVGAIPRAMLVVSIPASDNLDAGGDGSAVEVGGEHGRRALEALQNVVGRTADHWRPASSVESFEIVRRRLFADPDATARNEIAAVARQYVTFYRDNHGQFPRETEEQTYEERIRAAYPIHPELFERLYSDWSTLERFQRTRGVLRLMSTVIHALWVAGDASPLIMPGAVPLNAPRVASELTNYLPDLWKPIIDRDIDGQGSTPVQIDLSRPTFGARSLTQRIARTIFLGSAATLGTDHKGVERPRVWLGVAVPGDTVGNFGSALELLGQQATYLYVDNARYWYATTASVTRTAADIADRLREEPEQVWAEIVARLRVLEGKAKGDFAGVHVAPISSADVPDIDEARLVIIHPQWTHAKGDDRSDALKFAEDGLLRIGAGQRNRRNMVVFVAADQQRYEDLNAGVRDFLAWKQIAETAEILNLTAQQAAQARTRRAQADQTVAHRLISAYTWALVPEQDPPTVPPSIRVEKVSEGATSIAVRVTDKLRRGGELATTYGALGVRMALNGPLAAAWKGGHITVGQLWDLYSRYPYLDRLRDRRVLETGLLSALGSLVWEGEGFALATGRDEDSDRYMGLVVPGDSGEPLSLPDSWIIVRPDRAISQRVAETAERERTRAETTSTTESDRPKTLVDTDKPGTKGMETRPRRAPDPDSGPARPVRFFGSVSVDPERYNRDFAKVGQEVIQHLAAAAGTEFEVTIEIHAKNNEGFSPETVRTVSENAATLKFTPFGFEDA
jgi:alkylhydroperoxidase/carboxymuconolactone decarboxylase family protein YurZ